MAPSDLTENPQYAIRKVLAEFRDPKLEREYCLHRFPTDRRHSVVMAVAIALTFLCSIALDLFMFLPARMDVVLRLLPVRVFSFGLCIGGAGIVAKSSNPKTPAYCFLVGLVLVSACYGYVIFHYVTVLDTSVNNSVYFATGTLLLVLFPFPLRYTVPAATLFVASAVMTHVFLLHTDPSAIYLLAFMMVLGMFFAGGLANVLHRTRRREFVAFRQLEAANAALETEIEARRRDQETLVAAKEQSEEANQAKSIFLSSMSHELRTPLMSISGYTELLKEEIAGPLSAEQRRFLDTIERSGNHLLDLIVDLLDVSKIDAGAVELDVKEVSIDSLLEGARAMMREQAQKKDLIVSICGDKGLSALADERRCRQILLNLLTNAVKFTPAGGRVELGAGRNGDSFVKITVRDTGPGIEASEQDKIFSEFYLADRHRDTALGGSGIGLALARRLVELHGGEIGVESEVGMGSLFWFELPAGKNSAVESAALDIQDFSRGPATVGRRILVVDDNDTNLALILDILSIYEYDMAVARNGEEGLKFAQVFRPDLIIMDTRMPVMNGIEATRKLKSTERLKHIPVIALSASADPESVEKCMSAGSDAFLAKPFKTRDLIDSIERLL